MKNIIIGLLVMGAGGFLVIKTEWFVSNFGRITWFEQKLGTEGGSRLGYKLVGLVLLFIGVIVMTGSGSTFAQWLLGPLLKYSR